VHSLPRHPVFDVLITGCSCSPLLHLPVTYRALGSGRPWRADVV
jgi:hypothetical protein